MALIGSITNQGELQGQINNASGYLTGVISSAELLGGQIVGMRGLKGDKGDTGEAGADGHDGADGYSPSATVEKVGDTTTITITDKDGTTTADVYDGSSGASAFVAEYGVTTYADVKDAYDEDAIIICTVDDSGNTVICQLAYFDDANDTFIFAQPVSEGAYWASVASDDTWDDGYFQFASTDTATQLRDGLMSALDWQKLDGIASGAEANVQSDWSEADSTDDAYIKNKPTIPSQASDIGAQEELVSGTNIKTINSQSILGSGDLSITAGVSDVELDGTSVVVNGVAKLNKEIFVATQGVTPFSDILPALQRGATIFAKIIGTYSPATFLPMVHANSEEIHFGSIWNGTTYHAQVTRTDGWVAVGAFALAEKNSPALTGTPTAPTATAGTNTTQIATTAFVKDAVDTAVSGVAAYQGIAPTPFAPTNYKAGWYWIIGTAGTYCGQTCEAGDMIFCKTAASTYSDSNFDVVQTNLDISDISTSDIDTIVAQ